MTLVITNQSKNNFTITNNSKDNDMTWDQATFTWDDAKGTWDSPRLQLSKTAKTNITITNQSK